ncbi:MAG: hypothetical protein NUV69_04945 [Candidatus Curtissbacteria bacterium]|nr:hypothetical protein [Candidatus Curtissbacteria bacterium]
MTINIQLNKQRFQKVKSFLIEKDLLFITIFLTVAAIISFFIFYTSGLALAYNDARSHLDIGRRVVEGLKPGIAQLGSVWLPLPHVLMVPTIWNDFMWHTGLSGALISMLSFVGTGVLIYLILKNLNVGPLGRIIAVLIFALNINILYLQSTAMTELLLIFTMTAAVYDLMQWAKTERIVYVIRSSFWIMLSTLVRYDGWFLLIFSAFIIAILLIKSRGYKVTEGTLILFLTLGGFGIFLWVVWNLLIFGDPLYFAFGPFSARAQQSQLEEAGVLSTKGNILFSLKMYLYAMVYNTGAFQAITGFVGAIVLWMDKNTKTSVRIASSALMAPFLFNVLALFMGHSVLFIQGLSGNTWFNVRYGAMMIPTVAVFTGYLISKVKGLRYTIAGLFIAVTFFAFANVDAVTIDDARVGSSQKNVSEVSSWLKQNTEDEPGFILISAASHDAIIFSSGLPMKKYIHEGTGAYWESATTSPDRWAKWIVMRTNDTNDLAFKLTQESGQLEKYNKVQSFPFADIYELKREYWQQVNTTPTLGKQK